MLLRLEEAPSEERVNARFFCAFMGFHALASLGLFLLGRQVLFSLFQDIFNVLDFLQRFNFLLEYSAMIFRYEISLVEGLHNNHQVGLYLRDLHVCVVFCIVLYNIFKFAAQSFLVQFGLKLFFRYHLSNFASLLFNLTQCLHVSFDFNVLLGKIGFYLTFNFYVLVSQKFKSFHAKVFSFNLSLGSLLWLGLQSLRFSHCFAFVGILILWLYRKTSVVAIEIAHNNLFLNINCTLVRLGVICILGDLRWLSLCVHLSLDLLAMLHLRFLPRFLLRFYASVLCSSV
ncbi:Hypothetical_protein [Hexamita inflata]|uniref:Hypothetical_protein n=1 Tax=Hexamita inflata TaxID=28002 RepID=A0AA86V459_9EUKA|nr:Hypothetical protein HINF_LOCUS63451 [Hexamita inflata]